MPTYMYVTSLIAVVLSFTSSPPHLNSPPPLPLPLMQLGGPIWADAIHDGEFVRGLLSSAKAAPSGTYHTLQRINGLLTVISEVWVCTHTHARHIIC